MAEATPMGDVFNDDWQKMKELALPLAKAEGKVFHSFRHWCNNEMKQEWTCPAFVPPLILFYATFRSKATGLFQPSAECRRRGL